MACNIDTGYEYTAVATQTTGCRKATPGRVILFSPDTIPGIETSPAFTIPNGQVGLIESYGLELAPDYHIYLERLVVQPMCREPVPACGADSIAETTKDRSVTSFWGPMTLGNDPEMWSMIKYSETNEAGKTYHDRLQLLIAIPGTYRLRLESTVDQLGSLEVELSTIKVADLQGIPQSYYAGVK
jgi:hypothetical protein